ncbi:MAG: hypothetical protein PSN34_06855 [Urechidicola sp.]|nr:hypothetical protein [Urechidicola sp.]
MKKVITFAIFVLLILITSFYLFNQSISEPSPKITSTDLFNNTIVKSQFFDINPKKDTIVIGQQGTKIVIPENAFLDSDGNIVSENIEFELSEAFKIEDMILSNLTTSSNGKLLETDGMIFTNATSSGKNLTINKKSPLYIEIPTQKRKSNMMLYDGVRDSLGNMNWINPKKFEQYLIPIDLELLDFLPDGFKTVAKNYLDYYQLNSDKKDIDSLYYNLPLKGKTPYLFIENLGGGITGEGTYGVNPSSIETIKSKEFNNTFIATKEFEERLNFIHKTCENYILDLYINNLKKNLWEIDSLVIESYKEQLVPEIDSMYWKRNYGGYEIDVMLYDTIGYVDFWFVKKFREFKNQRLTNVEHKNPYINQLKEFYNKQLLKNQKRADKLCKIAITKENESAIRKEYNSIKKEREKVTMQSYGFVQDEFGWKNIDRGTVPKTWNYQQIEIIIENDLQFDQVHTYVLYEDIKSMVKLSSINKRIFTINEDFGSALPVGKNSKIHAVSIAYKEDLTYYSSKSITTNLENNSINNLSLELSKIDNQTLKKRLSDFNNYDKNSNIEKDLELSRIIENENQLKQGLIYTALPCYDSINKIYQ